MLVIPAIDLKGGRCVRLVQGDPERETVYSRSPADVALRWEDEGAELIHIVDLDGAIEGRPGNLAAVKEIVAAVNIPVQLGGGVRNVPVIEEVLSIGVRRVIVGTSALRSTDFLREAYSRFGEQVTVGIDARSGKVAVEGWQEDTEVEAEEFVRRIEGIGIAQIIYTDIAQDGMLSGPNLSSIEAMARATSIPLIAAGGVSSLEDVRTLSMLEPHGVVGMIIGKALYTGAVPLGQAIALAKTFGSSGSH